ncbi:hypothetical protein C9426_29235 [Serratia sp. S1B]|nr:hypothetical protein C9426_29235 [Serratia sp. S1B]
MKQRTMMFILLLAGILLGTVREAAADSCTATQNSYTMAPLTVSRDLPVGSLIKTVTLPSYTALTNCQLDKPLTKTQRQWLVIGSDAKDSGVVIGNAVMFETGIPGIGYSFNAYGPTACSTSYFYTITRKVDPVLGSLPYVQGMCSSLSNGTVISTVNASYVISFYKIGPISGSQSAGPLRAGYSASYFTTPQALSARSYLTINGLSVISKACSVSNSDITVNLDQGFLTDFTNVGSTAHTKAFNIDLNNCDAGINVSMYLEAGGAGSPDATLGLLSPDNDSSASGLAFQLLYNNNPIKLGAANAFKVLTSATTAGGSYSIPMAVRYYQTGASVKPGAVNSTATFTMLYN